MYSNNFLHKELRGIKNRRIQRKMGKFVRGLLKPIKDLPSASCCNAKCVNLASSHPDLLELWRKHAQRGQKDARRVLAEMLTHEEGSKKNCYKFISLVTGCSMNTISSVSKHMKTASGSKEPPEHGLKVWWRDNPKKRKIESSVSEKNNRDHHSEGEAWDSETPSLSTTSKSVKSLSAEATLSESLKSKELTALEVPKLQSDSVQTTVLEGITKEMEVRETGQNIPSMSSENVKEIIQIPDSTSSIIPDALPMKDNTEMTCDTMMLDSGSDRVMSIESESLPSGQHMQIIEVPVSESSSQTSVITSLVEKSQSQTSYGSPSQMEYPAVGVPVLVPYIVLLPGTVILDQSMP